jgi:SAM-dependent methyltransferase
MGNWDSIYQRYQQGGDAWATLSEGIDPRFITLIDAADFVQNHALDIGCGTGKYLSFLEEKGFRVDGIDSSPTAVEMTKKILSAQSNIQVANMFKFAYPEKTYDLIVSISTLHHGHRAEVAMAIQKIYSSLVSGGIAYITLPVFDVSRAKETFRDHTQIEPGTYSPNSGPEEGLPHSFYIESEVHDLFMLFENVSLELDEIGRWHIVGHA